jgi:hypothetical protein
VTQYAVVPATEAHARELAANMREEDAAECWAVAHHTPLQALFTSLKASRRPLAGLADDTVLCMFGVLEPALVCGIGAPWFLSSKDLPKHARAFLRFSRVWAERLAHEHSFLVNHVDARHTAAVRWVQWLGFTIDPAEPSGPDRVPFHRFWREAAQTSNSRRTMAALTHRS